jgi:mono/diheme cytochrome c family protein
VIFLKSRRGVNFAETSLDRYKAHIENVAVVIPPGTAGEKAGEQLITDRACTACHKLGDRDGGIAPDLSYEGLIRNNAWLMDHFVNPRSRVPDSIMPTFRFPEEDFQRITAYLVTLKTPPSPMAPAETYKALCERCHGQKGDGEGKVAWYLDPSPRDLTKAAFMNSKPRERFVNSIQEGVAGTSMPSWKNALKPDQVNGVLTYVLATFTKEPARELKPRNVPETNPVATSAASIKHGEQVFLERCTGCHGRKADGKGPNSLDITPKPRNLRNSAFVASVNDHRLFESILYGVQGTAMPSWIDYGLSKTDVGDIVNFIHSINQKQGSQQNAGR